MEALRISGSEALAAWNRVKMFLTSWALASDVYKRQVEGRIDLVIFLSDPLTAAPHDPDVKALLRIAQVYDIPIANTKATADFMITSPYMDKEYDHEVINFRRNIEERAETL